MVQVGGGGVDKGAADWKMQQLGKRCSLMHLVEDVGGLDGGGSLPLPSLMLAFPVSRKWMGSPHHHPVAIIQVIEETGPPIVNCFCKWEFT